MKSKRLNTLLANLEEVIVSHNIHVALSESPIFNGLRWCVIQTHPCKIPKWQFWRVRYSESKMYGPFPSRSQAVKFANYLTRTL